MFTLLAVCRLRRAPRVCGLQMCLLAGGEECEARNKPGQC